MPETPVFIVAVSIIKKFQSIMPFVVFMVSQPEVRLGLSIGEQYYLEDLLYSLMLQSHNDSAVAIAECIGGSVDNFSAMMNAKAKEI